MNELKLKQAKRIGRKWGYINTVTGVIVAFLIFFGLTGFLAISEVVKSPYLYMGISIAFILTYFVGGSIAKHIINGRLYSIARWIFYYFLISFFSVAITFFIASLINSKFDGMDDVFWMFLYSGCTLIVGAIPILIFGYIYGRKLEDEISNLIINGE